MAYLEGNTAYEQTAPIARSLLVLTGETVLKSRRKTPKKRRAWNDYAHPVRRCGRLID